ncbi:helix-turn-helix domain-containing protein [Aquaspirillum sp. LM1]|uniref:helix-turn-helix domain-containing protein n=1 Tax=Aquaspirillum sp. LM1 TaxID=1938604 RepID=UPI0015C54BA1|nr:helix-turn-helix domain-containing protein [Aquaspirillum sp. LM1]
MPRLQAFKYAFMPNGEAPRHMRRFAGLYHFVFNPALVFTLPFPRKINIRLCRND